MQRNYEVLRLIQQNEECHIIIDYMEGKILGEYIAQNPKVDKEQFYDWIMSILTELKCLEKIKKGGGYKYLSPFQIVVKRERGIALLNLQEEKNEKVPVVKKFLPEDGTYSDIYSFGKTMQYLLAKTKLLPKLTYKEEFRFQKIISKCLSNNSKKKYRNFEQIISEFSKSKKRSKKKKVVKMGVVFCLSFILILQILNVISIEEKTLEEENLYFEMGRYYFLMQEDYQKSREVFRKIQKLEKADYYEQMSCFMLGAENVSEEEIEVLLQEFQEFQGDRLSLEDKQCMMRIYSRIDTESAKKQVIQLGEEILEEADEWSVERKLSEILASSYESMEMYEKALNEYKKMTSWMQGEEIYRTMLHLCEKGRMEDEILSICEEGMERNKNSLEMKINYIRLLCENKDMPEEEKNEKIQELLSQNKELLENEEFQKLQVEYGIKIEGERVWAEK